MSLKKYLQHNTPVILSGLASIGVVVTAVTAVKATPKAIQLLEEAEKKQGRRIIKMGESKSDSSYISTFNSYWRHYDYMYIWGSVA